MAISRKYVRQNPLPAPSSPIRYLTENGFSIVRLCDLDASIINQPDDCRFLVQREDRAEQELRIAFDEGLIARLQIRRRTPLSRNSVFWLVCAESYLANYLWEKDDFPPDGELIVGELSPDELMLALHWRDRD